MKKLTPIDAYKELIDELAEKHAEDSFKERLLLEVLPSARQTLLLSDDFDALVRYALERLRKK